MYSCISPHDMQKDRTKNLGLYADLTMRWDSEKVIEISKLSFTQFDSPERTEFMCIMMKTTLQSTIYILNFDAC